MGSLCHDRLPVYSSVVGLGIYQRESEENGDLPLEVLFLSCSGVNHVKIKIGTLSIFLVVVVFPFLLVDYQLSFSDPYDAFSDAIDHQTDAVFTMKQMIVSSTGDNEAIYFFLNENESISVGFVTKGMFGWKSGLLASGSSSRVNVDAPFIKRSYTSANDRVMYGVIASPEVSRIQVGDQTATMLPLDFYLQTAQKNKSVTFWYLISDHIDDLGEPVFLNPGGEAMNLDV